MSLLHRISPLAALVLAPGAGAQIAFQGATHIDLVGARPDWIASGDFDGQNGSDLAVSSGPLSGQNGQEFVEIWANQGNGTFSLAQAVQLGQNVGAAAVVPGDYDLDGDLDIAVSQKNSNNVRILINTGGTFSLGDLTGVGGQEPRHMAAGDVDADGDLDLVTSSRESNLLTLLLNDGAGNFVSAGNLAVGEEPRHVVIADLNGDCMPDIAVSAHDSRRIDILFNNGAGGFGAVTSVNVPGNDKPGGLVAADLDGDGDLDLATTTDDDDIGFVVVFRNNGAGVFTTATYATNGLNPGAIIAADVDGDGDLDLAVTNEDSNSVSVLANNGAGGFAAGVPFAVGVHPDSIAWSDFDGNGSADLATANRDSGSASVLLNQNTGGTETYCVTSPNSAGAGARIGSTGSLSIAAGAFTLTADCAPANQTGVFFYGGGTAFAPFGNGFRCVSATLFRLLPPTTIGANGRATRTVDFGAPPASGGPGAITAGSTWYFQFWYRDPAGGGAAFNVSDALRATFNG